MGIPKLSKLQQRMNSNKVNNNVLVYPKISTTNKAKPEGVHIAFMSRLDCVSCDHAGAVVISIGDPDRQQIYRPTFEKADATLHLEFNPTSSHDDWIQKCHQDDIVDFLSKHAGKSIHIHCSQGSIRSPSLALGIWRELNEDDENIKLYYYLSGKWCINDSESIHQICYIDGRVEGVGSGAIRKLKKLE